MNLSIPPEPTDLKRLLKEFMTKITSENWDVGSFIVWFGNKLPAYLWTKCNWKSTLMREGWTWQSFLKFLSRRTDDIIKWVNGELSWEQLVNRIISDLKSPTIKMIYLRRG